MTTLVQRRDSAQVVNLTLIALGVLTVAFLLWQPIRPGASLVFGSI